MRIIFLLIACIMALSTNGQEAGKRKTTHADSINIDDISAKEFPGLIPAGNYATLEKMRLLKKKYGLAAMKKVSDGNAWIGMTDELCRYGLSLPNERKNTYTKAGKTEVWIYQGIADGCAGSGCPYLDYIITFKDHKAIAMTTGD